MIEFACTCARGRHAAPVENYIIERGAIEKIPSLLAAYHNIYVVCDQNTYNAAGKRVEKLLAEHGMLHRLYVIDGETVLPDAVTLGKILLNMSDPAAKSDIFSFSPQPDFILAVGSGTVNDSCRLVSYRFGIPYGICGTAPSMDGYLSAGSPIVHDGTKTTVQGTTPRFLIADLDIMKDAPYDMLLAGIGDMFGKYTGLLDWELARDMTGEYFCDKIASDVLDATNSCLENGYNLEKRDPESIRRVMEGFTVTGLGMAYTGNSRPASGAEHIIAHAWELMDIEDGNRPHLHGLEVCEATRLVAIMYRKLYTETDDEHVRALIEKYLPYFDRVEDFCCTMHVPPTVTVRARMLRGVHRALTLRDRYTILFYLRDRNLLETYAAYAVDALCEAL